MSFNTSLPFTELDIAVANSKKDFDTTLMTALKDPESVNTPPMASLISPKAFPKLVKEPSRVLSRVSAKPPKRVSISFRVSAHFAAFGMFSSILIP